MPCDNAQCLCPAQCHTNKPQGKVGRSPRKEHMIHLQPYDLGSAKEVALSKATAQAGLGPKCSLGVCQVGCWGPPALQ